MSTATRSKKPGLEAPIVATEAPGPAAASGHPAAPLAAPAQSPVDPMAKWDYRLIAIMLLGMGLLLGLMVFEFIGTTIWGLFRF